MGGGGGLGRGGGAALPGDELRHGLRGVVDEVVVAVVVVVLPVLGFVGTGVPFDLRHAYTAATDDPNTRQSLTGKKEGRLGTPTENEPSRGSLVHGRDMGNTQDHRGTTEQWSAVVGWRSPGAVLKGCPQRGKRSD